jgi:hypothetical protein
MKPRTVYEKAVQDFTETALPWWHRPTDAQVIAGTILGIANMAINASMYRRHW